MAARSAIKTEALTGVDRKGSPSARGRLLACAADIFAKRGFVGASVAEIALRADISKSTVFHHFPNKRALYLAVIETAVQDFSEVLEGVFEHPGSLDDQLKDYQAQHMAHIFLNEQVAQLVLRELQKNASQESAHLVRDVLSHNFQRLVGFISEAQANQLVRSDVDPSIAALTLISTNVFFFQHRKILKYLPNFNHADDPQSFAESVSDLIVYGLCKDTLR